VTDLSKLPAIADGALPRAVREGSAADKRDYKAALGFERLLVAELVGEMTKGSPLADGVRAGAVSDALADSLQGAGGLGLAPQLYAAMKLRQGER
jgi:hypothetical protein